MNEFVTPQDAYGLLVAGNARFAAGTPQRPHQDSVRRAATTDAQNPFAVVFSCSDSRVPAEIIFDQGLGDLFMVRTAGHVMGPEVIGSIEYGVSVLGCPLVVILGHQRCGAVAAAVSALDNADLGTTGYVRDVVERVTPHVIAARAQGVTDPRDLISAHTRCTVDQLLDRSRALTDALGEGRIQVVGMTYDIREGIASPVTGADVLGGAAA
ncbi:carbonic anhydrase [Streptomyces sp. NPDC058045]|uniref:carbonic anhydrase n=1 Tax=Streptomyces sp. NPDC058045 TaxID=3346311 RepID=UPI0036E94044